MILDGVGVGLSAAATHALGHSSGGHGGVIVVGCHGDSLDSDGKSDFHGLTRIDMGGSGGGGCGTAVGGVVDGDTCGGEGAGGGEARVAVAGNDRCGTLQCHRTAAHGGVEHILLDGDGINGLTTNSLCQRCGVGRRSAYNRTTPNRIVDGGSAGGASDGNSIAAVVLDGRCSHLGDGQLGHGGGEVAGMGGDGLDGDIRGNGEWGTIGSA